MAPAGEASFDVEPLWTLLYTCADVQILYKLAH